MIMMHVNVIFFRMTGTSIENRTENFCNNNATPIDAVFRSFSADISVNRFFFLQALDSVSKSMSNFPVLHCLNMGIILLPLCREVVFSYFVFRCADSEPSF